MATRYKECREDPPLTESERAGDERETDQEWTERVRSKLLWGALHFAVILLIVFVVVGVVVASALMAQTTAVSSVNGFTVLPSGNVVFSPHYPDSYAQYTALLDEFALPYQQSRAGGNVIDCEKSAPNRTQVCDFKASWLDSCNKAQWGFQASKPCVLLTYRDDPTYQPVPFVDPHHLPAVMPLELVSVITENYNDNRNVMDERVWVYCSHAVSYHPFQGLMMYNFPNKDCGEYEPPLVGVFFDLTTTNELVVECSIWSSKAGAGAIARHSFTIKRIDRNVTL